MSKKAKKQKLTSLHGVKCPECESDAIVKAFINYNFMTNRAHFLMECRLKAHLFLAYIDVSKIVEVHSE